MKAQKSSSLTLKSATAEQVALRRRTFVASTDAVDRHGEVIEQKWRLERYKLNPVVLFAHNSWDLPIGKCVNVGVVSGRLECEVEFASSAANPEAEKIWRLVQEGVLNAVSVGFRPNDIRYEMRDGKEIVIFSDNELFEISVVPIGANPDALAKMKALVKSDDFDARFRASTTEQQGELMRSEIEELLDESRKSRELADIADADALFEEVEERVMKDAPEEKDIVAKLLDERSTDEGDIAELNRRLVG